MSNANKALGFEPGRREEVVVDGLSWRLVGLSKVEIDGVPRRSTLVWATTAEGMELYFRLGDGERSNPECLAARVRRAIAGA